MKKTIRKLIKDINNSQFYGDTDHNCPIKINWHLHQKYELIDEGLFDTEIGWVIKPTYEIVLNQFYCSECNFITNAEIDPDLKFEWICLNPQKRKKNKWKEKWMLKVGDKEWKL